LLASAREGLSELQQTLTADSAARGRLPGPSLSTAQHQRLDADLDQLLETLSGVPALLYPRTDA
jgi:hypothetical protein